MNNWWKNAGTVLCALCIMAGYVLAERYWAKVWQSRVSIRQQRAIGLSIAILSILQVLLIYVLFRRPPNMALVSSIPSPLMLFSLVLAGIGWLLGTQLFMETKNKLS